MSRRRYRPMYSRREGIPVFIDDRTPGVVAIDWPRYRRAKPSPEFRELKTVCPVETGRTAVFQVARAYLEALRAAVDDAIRRDDPEALDACLSCLMHAIRALDTAGNLPPRGAA